jgi:hypothetical protein
MTGLRTQRQALEGMRGYSVLRGLRHSAGKVGVSVELIRAGGCGRDVPQEQQWDD